MLAGCVCVSVCLSLSDRNGQSGKASWLLPSSISTLVLCVGDSRCASLPPPTKETRLKNTGLEYGGQGCKLHTNLHVLQHRSTHLSSPAALFYVVTFWGQGQVLPHPCTWRTAPTGYCAEHRNRLRCNKTSGCHKAPQQQPT
jgi:hypothetical protein